MKNSWLATATEICLIVLISCAIGLIWNRNLITSAWRGEVAGKAAAAPSSTTAAPSSTAAAPSASATATPSGPAAGAPAGVEPMPLGLMQVKELVDGKQAVLLDARSATQYAEGHIKGALSLPLEKARQNAKRPLETPPAADTTIIAYCNGFSCHDSMDLAKILIQAGFASVYVYEGGYPEWRDAGYPVAKGGS